MTAPSLSRTLLAVATGFSLLGLGCAKKVDPETALNRGQTGSNELTDPSRGFNSGVDDLSPTGNDLQGTLGNDLLVPRDSGLDAFSDPLNVIRPFDPVYFGFDQYNVSATERPKLVEISEFIQSNPKARLLIEGYCDWKGTPEYNKSLGDRRATTVKDYLVELGADEGRIETVSIGDESALPNASGEQARLDRRAAFVVTKGL
ncbi:MAG: OmpA family protein [Verrucomicrobiota bacterium]|jgi:peptidoglycan-associated lipoprotein|nr:flagellar motor protein MotB [Opitutae bacterium]MEC7401098.1 OmpA family protein [Verrucomicrobiota bacterium]MED5279978.1 OmpA family protein [Verrucomicrobiota bacterium]MEE3061795.1 OmpA family protein [Verrucomicrobiota bacterium]HBJ61371.1 flagellar motor protein MotB [Opitutae bacterium]|tara:strand:+ start:509 stop:1117 length:609 start_codon:yes stop_codon:yes gene_type:complete